MQAGTETAPRSAVVPPVSLPDPVLPSTRPAGNAAIADPAVTADQPAPGDQPVPDRSTTPDQAAPEPPRPGSTAPDPAVLADRSAATGDQPVPAPAPGDQAAAGVAAPDVMAHLALVLGAAGPGGLGGVSGEQALQVVEVVEAVEAVKAWADAVSVEATAVLVGEIETDLAGLQSPAPSAWERKRFRQSCRSAAVPEIQVGTGLPVTWCQRRVWLACCEGERVGGMVALMRAGRVSLARVMDLAEGTAHLDAHTASVIAARVLRPLTGPDGKPLPGVAPLSQGTFRARLHRQLVLHNGLVAEAERTDEEAVKARCLTAQPQPHGTGALVITGDGSRITAAQCRVDKIARRLRKDGDERTLDQLRADVATDLLMRGWIPDDPTFTTLGQPPTATVQLIVTLPTLLGLNGGVGQIPGWGCVSSRQAQDLALRLGSVWKRVVTDPVTGRAIEATAGTYTVPAGMAAQVKTRDGTCRAPGCEIPTDHTDLDHTTEWQPGEARGATAETNLVALHRRHHNLKTSGFWDSTQSPDGIVRWTTATGRTFTTYPYTYDHPDNVPFQGSTLEAHHGRRIAPVINPDIPLPGLINPLDAIDWAQALASANPQPSPHLGHSASQPEAAFGEHVGTRPGPPPF